jgi:outer membrane protein assembly factor BamE
MRMKNIIVAVLGIAFVLLASGCSWFKPYKVGVQQGNVIEQKCVTALKIGMTKAEVKGVMGNAILNNPFGDDCWMYVYTNQVNGGKIERKNLTLYFANGRLVKMDCQNLK